MSGRVRRAIIAAQTDTGVRRDENQDVAVVDGWASGADAARFSLDGVALDRSVLLAVVDGMGGHRGGAYAAWLTARTLIADGRGVANGFDANEFARRAHETVSDAGAGLAAADMGAAFAALVLRPDGLAVFNIGDCRVYRLTEGLLAGLTVDDTGPSRRDPSRTVLTQAIGGGGGAVVFDAHWFETPWSSASHRFLLASDGLLVLADAEAADLAGRGSPADAVAALVTASRAAGAPDNITVIVVDVVDVVDDGAADATAGRPAVSATGPTRV